MSNCETPNSGVEEAEKLRPVATIPHSPNWDSIQVMDYLDPYLAYCSNEQIFVLERD